MDAKGKVKKCRRCKAEFTLKTRWQLFCSTKCRLASFKAERERLIRLGRKYEAERGAA